jgi:hypothetical protein
MNRRNFLRGLLATAAIPVIGTDLVVRSTGPCNVLSFGGAVSRDASLWQVSWTKEQAVDSVFPGDWHYVSRICNIDCSEASTAHDIFALLAREPDVVSV